MTHFAYHLAHRSILAANGSEAASFLNRILTCNVEKLSVGDGTYGAFLTPQGKILTDLFIFRTDEGLLIDLPASEFDAMTKRLTMLKLRADVQFEKREDLKIVVCGAPSDLIALAATIPPGFSSSTHRAVVVDTVDAAPVGDEYNAMRTAAVFPEFGTDYGPSDVFPADINMDLTSGIDFKKGCFVGQEVVSRMKRKTEVRKRLLRITSETDAINKDDEITAGGSTLGTITSWTGHQGLALIRLDRLASALENGNQPTVNDHPVTCHKPSAAE